MKQLYVSHCFRKDYIHFMDYVVDYLDHPQKQAIERRVEILKFFDRFGAEATKLAFKKSRSTIFLWKQRLVSAAGKLSALAPGSRAPIHRRQRNVAPVIIQFIISYRKIHPGADKATITPALAAECQRAGIRPISKSTIGRIIRDLKDKGRLPKTSRIKLNGRTGQIHEIRSRQMSRKARRKCFQPAKPGDLVEMDTVAIFAEGLKRYIFTGIDVTTRFAFAYTYSSDSSANGQDFLSKFAAVAPFPIRHIQTDNGSEFLKHFNKTCQDSHLVHFFNYPHHPQSNGHLERFNRTIQEQFADWRTDSLDDPEPFNRALMDYLIWYNTQRPHRGIGKRPPLRYYLEKFAAPQSNMLWTLTLPCHQLSNDVE